ncbi:MAG: acylphosphatase [Clostridia bacterium]|nr:acylphosphatase [Clostridia bacterium]
MNDTIIRKRIRFHGLVQGVGFRYRARHAASAVGATGWVRNDPDGSVSMEIQGNRAQIDQVVEMIDRGMYVRIEAMEEKIIPIEENERDFTTKDSRW